MSLISVSYRLRFIPFMLFNLVIHILHLYFVCYTIHKTYIMHVYEGGGGGGGVQLNFCTWPPDFLPNVHVQNMFFPVWKFPG